MLRSDFTVGQQDDLLTVKVARRRLSVNLSFTLLLLN